MKMMKGTHPIEILERIVGNHGVEIIDFQGDKFANFGERLTVHVTQEEADFLTSLDHD